MKKLNLVLLFALMAVISFAQSISGVIVDGSNEEPLIGASVSIKGTTNGALTDLDGKFMINNLSDGSYTLVMSYVGYEDKTLKVNVSGDTNVGTVAMTAGGINLESVVISGTMDIVRDRRTPVAVSTILASEIQAKSAGNVELTEVAKATPSVYIANQSGGYGDSEVFTRGFDQTNTAFLLNGQPINGMEDGKMYWSNWSGLTDVASAIQIQRGLGASKLAISSVGGTWNFIMKSTDNEKGGGVSTSVGNNNYQKVSAFYNTGLVNDKWGVSVLLSNWSGDGWANGTKGQGQTYFVSAGYKAAENHSINFLLTGAPQWHDQNFNKSISSHIDGNGEINPRYNNNWGVYDGDYFTERRNYYHKPVMNLNYEWDINDKSKFSTVLYASWGRGGGTGGLGSGRLRTESGLINFDATEATKDTSESTTYIRRASVNNHSWKGAVLNYERELNDDLTFSLGADLRTYTGDHFRQVVNLLGSENYAQRDRLNVPGGRLASTEYSPDPWKALSDFAPEDDRIAYDNSETINYSGLFGQLEYAKEDLSAYVQGAYSTQSHVRFERFNELPENEESVKVTNNGYNLKAGVSYSLNESNTVFVNAGTYSRQPFHDVVFLNFSNTLNPVTENEKITGLELGYKYYANGLTLNANVYQTSWKNRIRTQSFRDGDIVTLNGTDYTVVNEGYTNTKQDQTHAGVELDLAYRASSKLTVKAFGSVGDWKVDGDATTDYFNDNQELVDSETFSGENSIDGTKIGGAPQTSYGASLRYKVAKNLSTELQYIGYSGMYANVTSGELELPSYGVVDLNVSYALPLENGNVFRISANIYNLLDELYISQANSSTPASMVEAENWNGINMANRVRFGKTRTWNIAMKYTF